MAASSTKAAAEAEDRGYPDTNDRFFVSLSTFHTSGYQYIFNILSVGFGKFRGVGSDRKQRLRCEHISISNHSSRAG